MLNATKHRWLAIVERQECSPRDLPFRSWQCHPLLSANYTLREFVITVSKVATIMAREGARERFRVRSIHCLASYTYILESLYQNTFVIIQCLSTKCFSNKPSPRIKQINTTTHQWLYVNIIIIRHKHVRRVCEHCCSINIEASNDSLL